MDPNNTLRQPSPSSGLAVLMITVGTLAAIWGAVWYYFLRNEATMAGAWQYYVCSGVFLSGLAIAIIGVLVGRIGQEAQNADVPIGQVTAAAVQPQGVAPMPVQPVAPAAPLAAVPAQPAAPMVAAPPR